VGVSFPIPEEAYARGGAVFDSSLAVSNPELTILDCGRGSR